MKGSTYSVIVGMLFVLSACGISNEGATDYRYFGTHAVSNTSRVQSSGISNHDSGFVKYIQPNRADRLIKEDDVFTVSIKQVFVAKFTEWPSPMRIARGERANGEIAIIVNAFENDGTQEIDFSPSGQENARVVYFNDDVSEFQFLNLSNLTTVYGPQKYQGFPFWLDLYILEFDQPGDQLRKLVENMAAIGQTAYPPAAPYAEPLAKLAGSLIADNQDDKLYHFTMELKPKPGLVPDLPTSVFRTGHYCFIREENRSNPTKWEKLTFDEGTGRIYYKDKPTLNKGTDFEQKPDCSTTEKRLSNKRCEYRENTYITLEINKAKQELKGQSMQTVYSTLKQQLANQPPEFFRTDTPQEVLKDLGKSLTKIRYADDTEKQLDTLADGEVTAAENSAALVNFYDLWFSTIQDGDSTVSKYPFLEKDEEKQLKTLSSILSICGGGDDTETVRLLSLLKNRTAAPSDEDKGKLLKALGCIKK